MRSVYLDYNATRPIRPEVVDAMTEAWRKTGGNPASGHQPGRAARALLEDAREGILTLVGAETAGKDRARLIFTSGGTEANNLAVLGMAWARTGGLPGECIVSSLEHPSVLRPAEHLLDLGWRLHTIPATTDGLIRTDWPADTVSPQTAVVSVMAVNHELGTIQPIRDVSRICEAMGVPFHTDAVQAAGKIPLEFRSWGVSAMTLAAHKLGGPVGIGALVLRGETPISPILFGGEQQGGLRPGTECPALAVGMWKALQLSCEELEETARRLADLRRYFEQRLKQAIPYIRIHGESAARVCQTVSVGIPGADNQVLFTGLDLAGIACSIGSACTSGSPEPSPTLLAVGASRDEVRGSLRFSFGPDTTRQDLDYTVEVLSRMTAGLRGKTATRRL
ncbi:MAG: cysteine desulfurase [Thermogutta sp.]|nr:cysteine desulfurase [Thermogutta sp.]